MTLKVVLDVTSVPAHPAGAGQYILRLAEALARRDDVDLVVAARRADPFRWRSLAVGADVVATAPGPRPLRLAWEQVGAGLLARRTGADVWHGPHYTMPLLSPVPAVVTIHDLTLFDHPEWHERSKVQFFQRAIRLSVRRAGALVAVSDATARRLRELLDPTVPVVVAPHGVDTGRFRPDVEPGVDEALLAALGVRRPFVAFVGTVEPRKNIPGLIAAMEHLDPEIALVLAGQAGWGVASVDAAIAASPRAIVRLGYVADEVVPALYRQAAAVAYPALEEGFGLPVLEALACGAAVVTTEGTPMADLIGEAAVLVPAGEVDALGDGLRHAVEGRGPEPALGPRLARLHSWESCATRHVEAYRLALDR